MHFAKCKNPNVLNGCPQQPHGHIWADDGETQRIFVDFLLTNKEDAKRYIKSMIVLGDGRARTFLMSSFELEIDGSDLPENSAMEGVPRKKSPHLKLVK
jgi:hypothetical protein